MNIELGHSTAPFETSLNAGSPQGEDQKPLGSRHPSPFETRNMKEATPSDAKVNKTTSARRQQSILPVSISSDTEHRPQVLKIRYSVWDPRYPSEDEPAKVHNKTVGWCKDQFEFDSKVTSHYLNIPSRINNAIYRLFPYSYFLCRIQYILASNLPMSGLALSLETRPVPFTPETVWRSSFYIH